VFVFAFVAGIVVGLLPDWQLNLPRGLPLDSVGSGIGSYTGLLFGEQNPVFAIAWQNGRILLAALILSTFSFGIAGLILTPAVYLVLGYLVTQVIAAGYNAGFMVPAILTHGIVEIPVIVLAVAASLRLGAVVTRLPAGMTLGAGWTQAFGDTAKIVIGVIIPGLILAAILESYVTPLVVTLFLGG